MKHLIQSIAVAALLAPLAPSASDAGPIQRACNKSDRDAATRALCRCIDKAANGVLSSHDQRLAATFFADPDKSQKIRQSDRRSDENFWERYVEYNARARKMCS